MSTIDTKSLEQIFEKALKDFPEQRERFHRETGEEIKQALDSNISVSVDDTQSHVRSWQVVKVGSRGGYAAIRPIGSREDAITGADSPGAITNYLNSGHAIRTPKKAGTKSRAIMLTVPGLKFYDNTEQQAEAIAQKKAEQFANELAKSLGG